MNPKNNSLEVHRKHCGFSLVELMVAITISLLIFAAMTTVLVSTSHSRNEMEKASRQIENGRYAIELLREDVQLAGYYGDYVSTASLVSTTPDPCTTILENMGFSAANYRWNTTANNNVPVGIFGYPDSTGLTCTPNQKSGTDILVIRRASTAAVVIDADGNNAIDSGNPATSGEYYLQASNCSDTPTENLFVMDKDPTRFTLHKVVQAGSPASCIAAALSDVRKYMVHIYYISTCNDCSGSGDGIPTLKVVELTAGTSACAVSSSASCGSMAVRPLAEGIEDLQLEYGIDGSGDGVPDGNFNASPATTADWSNVVAVKVFLLARNTETSPGEPPDTKTYIVDSAGNTASPCAGLSGTALTTCQSYKRHAYTITAKAINIAGRREQ